MKKIFILSFMFMFAFALSAQDQGRRGGMSEADMEKRYEEMKKELSLTAKQLDSIKAIDKDYYAKMRDVREKAGGDREKMREATRPLNEKRNERIKAILTEEQYTKYQKMEADRRPRGPRGGGGGGQ